METNMQISSKFLLFFILLSFCLTTCDYGFDIVNLRNDAISGGIVPGNNLREKLEWLGINAQPGRNYLVQVNASESIAPWSINSNMYDDHSLRRGNTTITFRGIGEDIIIDLLSNGSLFSFDFNFTFILENITLQGIDDNNAPLIFGTWGGNLIMNEGAKIINNSGGGVDVGGNFTMNGGEISGNYYYGSSNNYNQWNPRAGGGVRANSFVMNSGKILNNTAVFNNQSSGARVAGGVFVSGNFTMNNGEISNNTVVSNDQSWSFLVAGGVFVSDNFTMNNGEISGNTVSRNGAGGTGSGGVYVNSGTFTMNDGIISGNSSFSSGGGVYVGYSTSSYSQSITSGTFVMNGGEIFGNTATVVIGGSSSTGGGGVYIERGSFTKTNGTITGYSSDPVNGNVVKDEHGNIVSNRGHAVFATDSHWSNPTINRQENTVGSNINLSWSYNNGSPIWSTGWDF